MRLDDAGCAEQAAALICRGIKRLERVNESCSCPRRVDQDERAAEPGRQPGCPRHLLPRQTRDPRLESQPTAIGDECTCLAQNEGGCCIPILVVSPQLERRRRLALPLQEPRRIRPQSTELGGGQHRNGPALQEMREQRVELKADLFTLVPVGEEPLAEQPFEQRPGIGVIREGLRRRDGHSRQERSPQEKPAGGRIYECQDLRRKVIECLLEGLGRPRGGHGSRGLEVLEQQHQTRGPPTRTLLQELQGRFVRVSLGHDNFAHLLGAQPQLVGSHPVQQAIGLRPRQRPRRIAPTQHEERDSIARFGKRIAQDFMEGAARRHFMAIVEDDDGSGRQASEECAKIAAGEARQVGEIFRAET